MTACDHWTWARPHWPPGAARVVPKIATLLLLIGSWTLARSQPPSAVSISPSSGTGLSVTFTAVFSDPHGGNQIGIAEFALVPSLGSGPACNVSLQYGAFWLTNDAGTALLGPLSPGSAGTMSNSQCTVFGTGASYSTSGTTLTFTAPITFSESFAGLKQNYLYAGNLNTGLASGWQPLGTWTVGVAQPPP